MSDKMHYAVESRNREEKRITGRFFPQVAAAVVNTSNLGRGFTVVRGGTAGLFTITFDAAYPELLHADVHVAHATLVYHARVIAITRTSAGVTAIVIQVYSAANPGVAVDVSTAAVTSWISFDVVLSNTSKPNI